MANLQQLKCSNLMNPTGTLLVIIEVKCSILYLYVAVIYQTGSYEIRSPKPLDVQFRVGQVVRHKIWGYRGVIVGWDPIANVSFNVIICKPLTPYIMLFLGTRCMAQAESSCR